MRGCLIKVQGQQPTSKLFIHFYELVFELRVFDKQGMRLGLKELGIAL